ncbi:helix-turn-helix domain-containing protein [Haloechinothrix halophila]|uniref:helix-turn-helix domain-containing protein n=1 Tax=Haloechinothrix halophila TaxID=1069073 RepID=UPI0004113B64|nr:helix-turn-helix transcriptional regulator [Haloechinothrix halophila]
MSVVQQPDFGQRLKQLRKERGLSQRDVAGSVVNPSYISLLETGVRVPTLEVVVRLAEVLNVPPDSLIGSTVATDGGKPKRPCRLVNDLIARSSLDYGDTAEAQQRYQEAYQAALRDESVADVVEYGLALHNIFEAQARHEDRYQLLAELEAVAAKLDAPELLVKVDFERASAARETGRSTEAVELAERAASRVTGTALEGTSEHVRLLGVLISVRCEFGDVTEVPTLVGRIVEVADEIGRDGVCGRAHWAAAAAYAQIGHPGLAEEHIRLAKGMLGTPETPLREWARFSRAAAATLLDAGSDFNEVTQYLRVAKTTHEMVAVPGEAGLVAVLEVRHALATGAPARALELAESVPDDLPEPERVRLHIDVGRARRALGDSDGAITELRSAASMAEDHAQFRLATKIWREIDEIRSQ